MKIIKAIHPAILVSVVIAAAGGCVPPKGKYSQLDAQQLTPQTVQRVYSRLVGRNPSSSEVARYASLSYDDFVKELLDSELYTQEVFYNLHERRLLLTPEGNTQFLKNARNHYCAMRWDMDRYAGAEDYWDILSDTRHWLPVPANGCFSGYKAQDVATAMAGGPGGDGKRAQCRAEIEANLNKAGYGSEADFRAAVLAAGEAQPDKAFIFLEPGQKLLKAMLTSTLFPDLGSTPANAGAAPAGFYDFDISFVPLPRAISNPNSSLITQCAFDNLTPAGLAADEHDYLFLRVNLPDFTAGIHGTPYYLNRHHSKPKNHNLHRGRMMYFSYMCEDLPPDAANPDGALPVQIPELKPYFSADDQHAVSAGNCYQCHTVIQPLGNLFSRLAWGRNYNEEYFQAYTEPERLPVYPAGLWQGSAFFAGGGKWGLGAARDIFQGLPQANSCILDSVWAQLGSKDMPMLPEEKLRARDAFGNGKFKAALAHMMTAEKRISDYFKTGAITPVSLEDSYKCDDPAGYALSTVQKGVVDQSCKSCHETTEPIFFRDGAFDLGAFASGDAKAGVLKKIFCELAADDMPPASFEIRVPEVDRKHVACHFRTKIKDLVESEGASADWLTSPCVAVEEINGLEAMQ